MKYLRLIIITLFITLSLTKQVDAQKIVEYKASNGVTYANGDRVQLGKGSAPNGDFLYLQVGGWASVLAYDTNQGPDQLNVGRKYANTAVVIKKISTYKIKGVKKVYFVVGGGDISNYHLTIEDAIHSCEVVPCKSQNADQIKVPEPDKFDQLKKLKALLDDGALTKEEYDEQKKKILNQ